MPLGIAGAAGALGLGVALASLRPWLIGLAVVLLSVGVWQLYRGQRTCRRSKLSLVLFGLSSAVVVAVMIFPQAIAELLAAIPR